MDINDVESAPATLASLKQVPGLEQIADEFMPMQDKTLELGSAMEFVLEGLHQSRLLAKDDLENGAGYRDMLGSMFDGMDTEDGPPNPPRERGRR